MVLWFQVYRNVPILNMGSEFFTIFYIDINYHLYFNCGDKMTDGIWIPANIKISKDEIKEIIFFNINDFVLNSKIFKTGSFHLKIKNDRVLNEQGNYDLQKVAHSIFIHPKYIKSYGPNNYEIPLTPNEFEFLKLKIGI
jgi:hypothetical protein